MTKVMLVEDDKSLREIYGVRLLAEGYQIISAGDGEQALAMAVKEKPDLILSDVMMPKISGFDMLDILRATPETKDIKIIMMTALSSEDQRARGESLGANRYLVKSQVGIEDVVRTVHDVLADAPINTIAKPTFFGVPRETAAISTQPAPVATATPQQPIELAQPAAPTEADPAPVAPDPVPTSIPVTEPTTQTVTTPISAEPVVPYQPAQPVITPTPVPSPEPAYTPTPEYQSQPVEASEPAYEPTQDVETTTQGYSTLPPVQAEPTATIPPVATTPSTAPMAPLPSQTQLPEPTAPFSTAAPTGLGDRIINPIDPTVPRPDIAEMMSQELNSGSTSAPQNPVQ